MAVKRSAIMVMQSYASALISESQDNFNMYNKTLARNLGLNEAVIIGLLRVKFKQYYTNSTLKYFDGNLQKPYFYCTREHIEKETGLKEYAQRSAMKTLVDAGILEIRKEGLPAKNYYYIDAQALLDYMEDKCLENQSSSDVETKELDLGNPRLSNTPYSNTKKENTKVKNIGSPLVCVAKSSSQPEQILEYFNSVAGTKFRQTETNLKPIRARLLEKFTVDDCKLVIDYKVEEWKGTEMQKYLRPETLFRPSKFEGYLNAAQTKAPKKARQSSADTLSGHTVKTAFQDLSASEQQSRLSGIKF